MNARSAFLLIVTAAFGYIVAPLALPLVMGAVLAALFAPLKLRLEARKVPPGAASALLTAGITLVVLLPTAFLIFWGAKTGIQALQALKAPSGGPPEGDWATAILNSPVARPIVEFLSSWYPVATSEMADAIRDTASSIGMRAAEMLGQLLTHLPGMALDLALIVVSLYFSLVDGHRLVNYVRRRSFFPPAQTEKLIQMLAAMCRSVILAAIASAGAQAFAELVPCLALRVPNAPLIGIIVFVAAFVPVIGSSPVTFGVALQQLLVGRTAVGITLLVVAVIVAGLDNLVRALFLQGSVNLHPLLAFVAALGGLEAFGFLGIFLGPILAALFMVTLEIMSPNPAGPYPSPRV